MKRIVSAAIAAFFVFALVPAHADVIGGSSAVVPAVCLPSGPQANNCAIVADENETAGKCGTERWPVKVLTDSAVASVDFAPRQMTVEGLRALNDGKPAVASIKDADAYHDRRFEDEKHAVRVRAVLVGWKKEADRDFHIVIASPNDPSATMIAEPPDPACSTSPKAKDFAAVRAALVQCFGEPNRWKKLPAMVVDLDGIPFYDVPHGQTGHAPNAIELHPLMRIKTVSGACPNGKP